MNDIGEQLGPAVSYRFVVGSTRTFREVTYDFMRNLSIGQLECLMSLGDAELTVEGFGHEDLDMDAEVVWGVRSAMFVSIVDCLQHHDAHR